MADFILTVGEKQYAFRPEMVDLKALRAIKGWYGKELGRYNNFIEAFFEGDPDAAACAVWIARRAAGESNVPEPQQMGGFALTQWIQPGGVDEDEDEPVGNPTEDSPTPDTTGTPTSSGDDTSGRSPTSSDGPPRKSKGSGGSTS